MDQDRRGKWGLEDGGLGVDARGGKATKSTPMGSKPYLIKQFLLITRKFITFSWSVCGEVNGAPGDPCAVGNGPGFIVGADYYFAPCNLGVVAGLAVGSDYIVASDNPGVPP